jgi:hypothetical protein
MTRRSDRPHTIEEVEGQRDLQDIDRDGVASLHDVEAESGDEEGLRDRFTIDQVEAKALGVALDPIGAPEAELD